MDGVQIDSSAVAGALEGVGYAIDSLSGTINNVQIWTLATMFIGFSIGVGIALHLFFGHKNDSLASLSGSGSNGVTDAYWASLYMKQGGDIRNAANQEFIRNWSKGRKM